MVQNGTQCTVKNDDALHQQYSLKGKIVVQNHTECIQESVAQCEMTVERCRNNTH